MKPCKLILIFSLLFPLQIVFSQEMRIISGVMKDNSGEPLPGVNITVKGTTTGTTTDFDGKYNIKAPLGSVLIFSFIGFTSKEVTVTLKNSSPTTQSQPVNKIESKTQPVFVPVPRIEYREIRDLPEGTAVFTTETPSYAVINPNYNWLNDHNIEVDKVSDINFGSGMARINLIKDEYYQIPHISYYTSISAESHTRLPKIQNQFAQGKPVNGISQWMGPETAEVLSWGPHIRNLEFDGSIYDYDRNGRLVPKGTGNGKPANGYNSESAFGNGFTYTNNLKIFLKTEKKEYSFMIINKLNKGVLPGTRSTGNIADFKWKRSFKHFKIGTQLNLDNMKNNYLEGSPANSMVMASILTTPPTFDLLNGQKALKAYEDKSTWLITDNLQRGYAREKMNHPYWLLQDMRDKETHQSANGQLNLEVKLSRRLDLFNDIRYQWQENDILTGFVTPPYGIKNSVTTARKELLYSLLSSSGLRWYTYFDDGDINSSLRYDYYHVNSRLNRRDSDMQSESDWTQKYALSRIEQSLNWNTNLVAFRGLLFKMTHNLSGINHYRNNKILYSPTLALGVNINDLSRIYYGVVDKVKIKANWGYNYSFVPLTYAFGRYNYQHIPSSEFYDTSFENELFPDLSIHPEKVLKKNIGSELSIWNGKLSVDVELYEHKTTKAIFPVQENNMVSLKNAASTRDRGMESELLFYQNLGYRNNRAQFRLIFDHHRSKVLDLSDGLNEIPLGGFSDVHTSLIKGRPAGVIVGTAWKRDDKGNLIIGDDGYPLLDDHLKVIANPEPDFNLGFEATVILNNFTTSVLLEYRHGGEVWNGTNNVLSYLGLSEKTLDGRKVLEYVFPGVKQDGSVNATPVDFANPSKPLDQNRWYRYGFTGVAEDAIEDASWFRIREISVSYKFRKRKDVNAELSVFVRNPLLITQYEGVDPNITLWEKPNTVGLDLFNMPSVSSVGLSVKINL